MRAFLKIFTPDRVLTALQSNIANVLDPILRNGLMDNTILEVTLSTTGRDIEHKLGRQINGWIIVDKESNADVWAGAKNTKTIALFASATVKVKILVF